MLISSSISIQELVAMTRLKAYDHIRDRIRAVIYALQNETAEAIALQLDRPISWVQMWVYRYRDFGLDGLYDRPRSGSPSKLSPSELSKFVKRVLNGPLVKDEVSIFVGRDYKRILLDEFEKDYSLSGVYKLLHNIGFSSLVPRPKHERNDPDIMNDWLKEAPRFIRRVKKKMPRKIIQVWFLDEMRYGMQGFLRRIWALKGSRPTQKRQIGFKSGYIFGAVNPLTGDRVGLAFSSVDTEIVNIFLGMVSESVKEDIHIILIMDNAGFHKSKEMKIPANITILPLPPYSPELNPVERLWKWLKDHYLCNRIFKDINHILKAGCDAWDTLTNELIQSICSTKWLQETL